MTDARFYVPAMASPTLMTADELWQLHIPDKRVELVRGVLVVRELPGYRHGEVAARLAKLLMDHADAHGLGDVVVGDTGFKVASAPDTVRGPDIAFVCRDRLPHPVPAGFAEFAPDLAVEVLSPNDRPGEVLAKVADWLNAGTTLVWVVDPVRRSARVYRQDGSESVIQADGDLSGEHVLPGFSAPLATML
jgi:Uma2 family endonuclease